MKLRKNRGIEREAVNATRAFFEANGCVFQEVDLGNDYGKDAYVDFAKAENVTGICFAVQIKGGASFRRSKGYGIPLDQVHAEIWHQSTIPIIGIVYDPADSQLRWCNISNFLDNVDEEIPASIPISEGSILTPTSLQYELIISIERSSKWHIEHPLVKLCSESVEVQIAALYDCFALGRSDARVLIALRYLLKALHGEAFFAAIRILSHVTPHPDIFWRPDNWITTEVKKEVSRNLNWDTQEIIRMLSEVIWEHWDRGKLGEDVYMLLQEDPHIQEKMEQVAVIAIDQGEEDVAFTALYLTVYWAGDNGVEQYQKMVAKRPNFRNLPLSTELETVLGEFGYITMFE